MIITVIGNNYKLYITNNNKGNRDWSDQDIEKPITRNEFWADWRQRNEEPKP